MRRGLLGLVLLLVLTAGCGRRQGDDESLAIFKYNESAGILTLDPIYAKDLPHIWACNQLFNSLVAFDDKMNLVPMVAKSWDISEDGLRYTFHLRNDVQFHEDKCFDELTAKYGYFRLSNMMMTIMPSQPWMTPLSKSNFPSLFHRF